MVERYRPKSEKKPEQPKPSKKRGGAYFEDEPLQFIPTGCTLLDCVIGGGWPLGRCSNIVGDKSTGKTLLAIEAAANFAVRYPKGKIWYREAEAAFDLPYAKSLGLPVDHIDFGPQGIGTHWDTIDSIVLDVDRILTIREKGGASSAGLYIIDSLDALTSEAALKRKPGQGSYNLEKPKALGELFQKHVRRLKEANIALLIISQVRDRIGLVFGDKYTRSGGKALDFYASVALWLSHIGTYHRTVGGVKRATAIQVRAKCKKNKIAQPLRECEFFIRFGYGVDDLEANLEWLAAVGRLSLVKAGLKKEKLGDYINTIEKMSDAQYRVAMTDIQKVVRESWADIEQDFLPTRSKYGGAQMEVEV